MWGGGQVGALPPGTGPLVLDSGPRASLPSRGLAFLVMALLALSHQTPRRRNCPNQCHSSCHAGGMGGRGGPGPAGLCGLQKVTLLLWTSLFLFCKVTKQRQGTPRIRPGHNAFCSHRKQTASPRQSFRNPAAPLCLGNAWGHSSRSVPSRGPLAFSSVSSPNQDSQLSHFQGRVGDRKWPLPTSAPASVEKGQCSTTGGRR